LWQVVYKIGGSQNNFRVPRPTSDRQEAAIKTDDYANCGIKPRESARALPHQIPRAPIINYDNDDNVFSVLPLYTTMQTSPTTAFNMYGLAELEKLLRSEQTSTEL
jgi:hypothetical protein